ncbi:hypothetical protein QT971_26845 [Microcoleus sp. herbarium19]|uniref:hypothetical protein n=1 Tax=unclassified Microcoleus TaxID=2642155 RepID=UPI002FD44B7B
MTASRISARNLLREALAATGAIYVSHLIIGSPLFIFRVLKLSEKLGSASVALDIIYSCVLIPLVRGAVIFYLYRSLTGNQVTVNEAFQQANRRLWPLMLVFSKSALMVFAGFIALIIPGVYLGCRLLFAPCATVIDNCSDVDSLNSSFQLTQGREWLVFRSSCLILFVYFIPGLLIAILIDPTGISLASNLAGNAALFLVAPLTNVFGILLYLRLRESAATMQ